VQQITPISGAVGNARDDWLEKLHGRENGRVRGLRASSFTVDSGYADLGDGSGRCGAGPAERLD